MVKFNDANDFRVAIEKLKYFTVSDKHCRALPFDKDLLGSNRPRLNRDNDIFVKNIPLDWSSKGLEEYFSRYGPVKSAKVSINPDYSSRGYGFVCFQTQESAVKAVSASGADGLGVFPFRPKDRREVRRIFNNVYVKNFPEDWTEDQLR
jgi:polyadenylate-binding protein